MRKSDADSFIKLNKANDIFSKQFQKLSSINDPEFRNRIDKIGDCIFAVIKEINLCIEEIIKIEE